MNKGSLVKEVGINVKNWESQENSFLILKLSDSVRVDHKFFILDWLPANMVMGIEICNKLTLAGN
jgi:hypothetical protein